jgi:predicted SprT family Zn-dependent metalloprotease
MMVKRTWEFCMDRDIESLYDKVWDYVSLNFDLDDCPYLYLNKSNSIHNLGLFTCDGYNTYIVLNKLFLNHKDKALNTIIHEFAHYVAYKKYGRNCNHSWRWKEIASQIGRYFGENITTYCSTNHEVLEEARRRKNIREESIRYIIICSKCGHKFYYKRQMSWFKDRNIINNIKCTCPYCRGHKFEVEEN